MKLNSSSSSSSFRLGLESIDCSLGSVLSFLKMLFYNFRSIDEKGLVCDYVSFLGFFVGLETVF